MIAHAEMRDAFLKKLPAKCDAELVAILEAVLIEVVERRLAGHPFCDRRKAVAYCGKPSRCFSDLLSATVLAMEAAVRTLADAAADPERAEVFRELSRRRMTWPVMGSVDRGEQKRFNALLEHLQLGANVELNLFARKTFDTGDRLTSIALCLYHQISDARERGIGYWPLLGTDWIKRCQALPPFTRDAANLWWQCARPLLDETATGLLDGYLDGNGEKLRDDARYRKMRTKESAIRRDVKEKIRKRLARIFHS